MFQVFQVNISTQRRVLAFTCSDVATLRSYPVLIDSMIVDESSPLCDDVESTLTYGVTVQGKTGTTDLECGTGGTVIASSQVDPKATASVYDTKSPTLADLIKSQESLRKERTRAPARYRVERAEPNSLDIEDIRRFK